MGGVGSRQPSPGIWGADGRLMATSERAYAVGGLPGLLPPVPCPCGEPCWPTPPQETLQHQRVGLVQPRVGSLLLSSGAWCVQYSLCSPGLESVSPVLWKSCSQIPLAGKVRFPGDSQCLYWTPRLGSLTWGSEPSHQQEGCVGVTALQFVGCPPGQYGMWLCRGCAPAAVLVWPLGLWTGAPFSGAFPRPPVSGCTTASCGFHALTGDEQRPSARSSWTRALKSIFIQAFVVLVTWV